MAFGRRTPNRRGQTPPTWLVFLVGIALVFGVYYLWLGVQNFLQTGGGGVVEATERAQIVETTTAELVRPTRTALPAATPIPTCEDFVVTVPSANVRKSPRQDAAVLKVFTQDQTVCVLGRAAPDSEWYAVDLLPESRRLSLAYMHESVVQALHPTPTASRTATPLPTVTVSPSPTHTETPVALPTETRDPRITDTPQPTVTPTGTPPRQSALGDDSGLRF
jgi:hypothetical protein